MIETSPPVDAEIRLKRARMRAWRRGMREMDLILGGFIDAKGATLGPDDIIAFEALLDRRDQDLYGWIAGHDPAGPDNAGPGERTLIARIQAHLARLTENCS